MCRSLVSMVTGLVCTTRRRCGGFIIGEESQHSPSMVISVRDIVGGETYDVFNWLLCPPKGRVVGYSAPWCDLDLICQFVSRLLDSGGTHHHQLVLIDLESMGHGAANTGVKAAGWLGGGGLNRQGLWPRRKSDCTNMTQWTVNHWFGLQTVIVV